MQFYLVMNTHFLNTNFEFTLTNKNVIFGDWKIQRLYYQKGNIKVSKSALSGLKGVTF